MKIHPKVFYAIFLFIAFPSLVYADSPRDIDVDRAIAGMDEGSRMLSPDSPQMPGTALSPAADTKVIISPAAEKNIVSPQVEAQGGNFPGGVIHSPEETTGGTTEVIDTGTDTGTDIGGPSQEPSTEVTNPIIDVDAGVDTDTGTIDADVGVNPGGDQVLDTDVGGTEIDVGIGDEPSPETGETTDPIIDVDAGIDTDSGTVDADVGVNPEGDQLLDADVAGSEVDADLTESGLESETQVDIGGAVDIPVEDDIGDPQEPTDETSPIIDIDASADLDSGTVDADLGVNPEGDQLLDADVAGTGADTTGEIEADIGSTSDLTEPVAPVVAEPVVVAPPADLSAEVDTTGETVGDETEVGIEADVSGVSAGEDVVDDPTDYGVGGL